LPCSLVFWGLLGLSLFFLRKGNHKLLSFQKQ